MSGLLAAAFDVPVSLHSESGDGLWPQSVSCAVRHAAVFRRSLGEKAEALWQRRVIRHAPKNLRHEFETRLPPGSLAASRRGFAFCVADPVGSAHEFLQTG